MNNDLRMLCKEPNYKEITNYLQGVVARNKLTFDMQDFENNNKNEPNDQHSIDPEDIKNYIKGNTTDIQNNIQDLNLSEEEQFLKVVEKLKIVGI